MTVCLQGALRGYLDLTATCRDMILCEHEKALARRMEDMPIHRSSRIRQRPTLAFPLLQLHVLHRQRISMTVSLQGALRVDLDLTATCRNMILCEHEKAPARLLEDMHDLQLEAWQATS